MRTIRQGFDKAQHIFDRQPICDFRHDGRADNNPISNACNGFGLGGGVHTEPDNHGQAAGLLDALNLGGDIARIRFGRAGDAGNRHVIHKARGVLHNPAGVCHRS